MKKATFEIQTGVPDIDNDVIMPGALQIPTKKIPVLKDFDASLNGIIGECSVSEKDGVIKINADVIDGIPLEYCTHGIGFKILDFDIDENGNKIIKDAKLYSVGISGKMCDGSQIKQVYNK